ncbi:hypothetical protein LOD99_11129 [Oopsacas minuta]|uniref:Caspase family p20 domain-containing protein n=1 Tax=Oopsacas minuta TaxID=111878 RepID=A0AAV7KA77_9METZ|nr:hypothetical protein LOD99_11129 [Oopsacas minuta]
MARSCHRIRLESKIKLFIELGVENISDLTFINLQEMKEIHKFTHIQQSRLHRLQMQCALILGTDAPLVSGSAIEGDSKIPKYKIENLDKHSNYKGLGIILVVEKFSDGKVRKGANCDSVIFRNLFTKMGLNIVSIPNATQSDILYRVRFEIQDNQELPSIFISISSHGSGSDKIVCADNNTHGC